MGEERREVLRMLAEGKITADEAEQLLDSLQREVLPSPTGRRFLRLRVMSGKDTKVNINIPLSLAKTAFGFIPKQILTQHPGLNLEAVLQEIEDGAEGKLVEIRDDEDVVEIFVD